MASMSEESELTKEQILEAYKENKGTFPEETFRPKNAPKEFYEKPEPSKPRTQGGTPSGPSGPSGPGTPKGPGGVEPPEPPFNDQNIPPSKSNISMLLPENSVDIKAIKRLALVQASIDAIGKTLVAASTKGGVRPNQIFGNASSAAMTTAKLGFGAELAGAAGIAPASIGAAGAVAGPLGLIAAGVTLSASYLSEIADNTSHNVEAFSPELIMANIDNSLQNLANNMDIANKRGSQLATYQESSNMLSRNLYDLGIELFSILRPFIELVVNVLSFIILLLRMLAITLEKILVVITFILDIVNTGFKESLKAARKIVRFFSGWSTTTLPNFEEEFEKNDPRSRRNP